MSRSQEVDAEKGFAVSYCKGTEIGIVSEDDRTRRFCGPENISIGGPSKLQFQCGVHPVTASPRPGHDIRVDVLVAEQREKSELHAGIGIVQTTSFFMALAA